MGVGNKQTGTTQCGVYLVDQGERSSDDPESDLPEVDPSAWPFMADTRDSSGVSGWPAGVVLAERQSLSFPEVQ